MKMIHYPQLDTQLYKTVLPNGLTVMVVPKPGFSRKLAYFATDFGAIHRDFTFRGVPCSTPAGVAHFLEHKLFELPGRDVMGEFAAQGGNDNAFTSYDMTAYYFSCSQHFEENLKLLLEFVSTPYFTEESVQREYGIIDQEIRMCADERDSREEECLMTQMYRVHPVRIPILGTQESLREITPALLETCHRAFYTPKNMVLCVVGDVEADAVCRIARSVLGEETVPAGEKLRNWDEDMTCPEPEKTLYMEVSGTSFRMGFKCEPACSGQDAARLDVIGYLAAELLFGESTELYLSLYQRGLIDSSFGGGFETLDGCAVLSCGGDSQDPHAVRKAILERGREIAEHGIDPQEFLRLKRGALGRRIRDLDSFDATCYRLCAYHFYGFDYFTFPKLYEEVTEQQVQAFLDRVIRPERCAITITKPIRECGIPREETGISGTNKEETL